MYAKIPLNTITKMAIVQTNGKKTVSQVKDEQGCQYVINLTLYNFDTFEVQCPCRINGKTIATSSDGYWSYAFNIGSDFKMIHSRDMENYKNVFSCSAMLKDGQNTIFKYNEDQGGIRGRTAVGLDSKGNLILFCSKDGTKDAMSPEKLRSYMRYILGCVSGIMLDSGKSSSCDFNGKKITTNRKVANYLCIWAKQTTTPTPSSTKTKCSYKEPIVNVKRGSYGDHARWCQWYLKQLGFYKTKIDGIFGSGSESALIAFQKTVFKDEDDWDGICGAKTRKKLVEAYNNK